MHCLLFRVAQQFSLQHLVKFSVNPITSHKITAPEQGNEEFRRRGKEGWCLHLVEDSPLFQLFRKMVSEHNTVLQINEVTHMTCGAI